MEDRRRSLWHAVADAAGSPGQGLWARSVCRNCVAALPGVDAAAVTLRATETAQDLLGAGDDWARALEDQQYTGLAQQRPCRNHAVGGRRRRPGRGGRHCGAICFAGAGGSGVRILARGRRTGRRDPHTIPPRLKTLHRRLRQPPLTVLAAAATGAAAAPALIAYLLATREQLASVAVVLSSLYPVVPVLFGITVLGERLIPTQAVGLVAAGSVVALLASS
ncbi:MAG: hypothetical protein EOP32_07390 [Rhodococcus sp. (in: high G+C Gram-positive bacteria)]|nr:MAG: hypothetical protein EOP32_07390 [Rhodococcus sp. (in: high G+C Gram-positive bacteria)]